MVSFSIIEIFMHLATPLEMILVIPTSLIKVYFSLLSQLRSTSSTFLLDLSKLSWSKCLCVLRQSNGASIEEPLSSTTFFFFFFFIYFFFFSGKGWSQQSKLLHFGVLSKPANNPFNHTGFRFLQLNQPVFSYSQFLDNFRFLIITRSDWWSVFG